MLTKDIKVPPKITKTEKEEKMKVTYKMNTHSLTHFKL